MTEATAAAAPPAMTWLTLRPVAFSVLAASSTGSSVSSLAVFVIFSSFVRSTGFHGDG
jgi:hypothetical protein